MILTRTQMHMYRILFICMGHDTIDSFCSEANKCTNGRTAERTSVSAAHHFRQVHFGLDRVFGVYQGAARKMLWNSLHKGKSLYLPVGMRTHTHIKLTERARYFRIFVFNLFASRSNIKLLAEFLSHTNNALQNEKCSPAELFNSRFVVVVVVVFFSLFVTVLNGFFSLSRLFKN